MLSVMRTISYYYYMRNYHKSDEQKQILLVSDMVRVGYSLHLSLWCRNCNPVID